MVNSWKQILEDMEYVKNNLENVNLYLFSDGIHPNDYKLTATEEWVDQILINELEIERFLLSICN